MGQGVYLTKKGNLNFKRRYNAIETYEAGQKKNRKLDKKMFLRKGQCHGCAKNLYFSDDNAESNSAVSLTTPSQSWWCH